MGGNGFVEEGPFARFYREAPLNSIWEGSGNVMCLDVLRALVKVPAVRDALAAELRAASGANRDYDAFVGSLIEDLARTDVDESQARSLTERIAIAVQGAQVLSGAPQTTADAFCASRLAGGNWGRTFGTLPAGVDHAALLARALPN
jgi:putative acyl-CoA dehydrogenase